MENTYILTKYGTYVPQIIFVQFNSHMYPVFSLETRVLILKSQYRVISRTSAPKLIKDV